MLGALAVTTVAYSLGVSTPVSGSPYASTRRDYIHTIDLHYSEAKNMGPDTIPTHYLTQPWAGSCEKSERSTIVWFHSVWHLCHDPALPALVIGRCGGRGGGAQAFAGLQRRWCFLWGSSIVEFMSSSALVARCTSI